jgi:Carboxypeptidase regulatory-like domain
VAGGNSSTIAKGLFLISACASSITAQTAINGAVTDPSGASVPDATVELRRGGGHLLRTVQSDIGGNFRFSGVAAGSYSIDVQHGGFKRATSLARVTSGATPVVMIRLARSAGRL